MKHHITLASDEYHYVLRLILLRRVEVCKNIEQAEQDVDTNAWDALQAESKMLVKIYQALL